MDMNEMMKQLAANPQMAAQMMQMMQQNGMVTPSNQGGPHSPSMNWNVPTNPMAAMIWNGFMNSMNNMNSNQNNSQSVQNPLLQQNTPQPQVTNNKVSSVRVVKSQDEILADEIPGDGTISLFVQDDLKVIHGKRWTNNGTVDNMRFVLETDDQEISESQNKTVMDTDALFKKISEIIDERLEHFKTEYFTDNRGNIKRISNKKGVDENEL